MESACPRLPPEHGRGSRPVVCSSSLATSTSSPPRSDRRPPLPSVASPRTPSFLFRSPHGEAPTPLHPHARGCARSQAPHVVLLVAKVVRTSSASPISAPRLQPACFSSVRARPRKMLDRSFCPVHVNAHLSALILLRSVHAAAVRAFMTARTRRKCSFEFLPGKTKCAVADAPKFHLDPETPAPSQVRHQGPKPELQVLPGSKTKTPASSSFSPNPNPATPLVPIP
jgi:hypothetical protein